MYSLCELRNCLTCLEHCKPLPLAQLAPSEVAGGVASLDWAQP
jgi:hypothetical protein